MGTNLSESNKYPVRPINITDDMQNDTSRIIECGTSHHQEGHRELELHATMLGSILRYRPFPEIYRKSAISESREELFKTFLRKFWIYNLSENVSLSPSTQ